MDEFIRAPEWWRTEILTEIVRSADGVADFLDGLASRGKRAFFIVDDVLKSQPRFARVFEQKNLFRFDASASEPRTQDVDRVVSLVREGGTNFDVIAGVGGGSTMDLAKATAICTANPKPSADYQGYGLDMKKGADIWVLPTLAGTGAEVTPIAVLRGPEKKLGINNNFTAATVAVIDPQLSSGAEKFNRFYTMMDCFFHHFEITMSRTSSPSAVEDARDGREMSTEVLTQGAGEYDTARAIKSAMASVLGGSSTIGGRVGVSHAISYGLSNSAPKLPHSVAVTISMLGCKDIYRDGGYDETVKFLELNGMPRPKARDYGIGDSQIDKMTKTALGMEKLWQSHFGDDWKKFVDYGFVEDIYKKILAA
jgi:3-deoxy-alpha-D-manno-octulosonate 8-oxidase